MASPQTVFNVNPAEIPGRICCRTPRGCPDHRPARPRGHGPDRWAIPTALHTCRSDIAYDCVRPQNLWITLWK